MGWRGGRDSTLDNSPTGLVHTYMKLCNKAINGMLSSVCFLLSSYTTVTMGVNIPMYRQNSSIEQPDISYYKNIAVRVLEYNITKESHPPATYKEDTNGTLIVQRKQVLEGLN